MRLGAVAGPLVGGLLIVLSACAVEADAPAKGGELGGGSEAAPSETDRNAVATVVAAGDIAKTVESGAATAALVTSLHPDAVLALGDQAYERGAIEEYERLYDPTWGAFKDITRPVPGNHEYKTRSAAGYYEYFRDQVKDFAYYAWNAGAWRMYALNCEIACGKGSDQLAWLVADLEQHPSRPALAYLHRPRFTCSENHPPAEGVSDLWAVLQNATGQVVLGSHNHAYERFAPMDAAGRATPDGLRQFVVGTGGAERYGLREECSNREEQTDDEFGVLELELRPGSYGWRFVNVDGDVMDSGDQPITR